MIVYRLLLSDALTFTVHCNFALQTKYKWSEKLWKQHKVANTHKNTDWVSTKNKKKCCWCGCDFEWSFILNMFLLLHHQFWMAQQCSGIHLNQEYSLNATDIWIKGIPISWISVWNNILQLSNKIVSVFLWIAFQSKLFCAFQEILSIEFISSTESFFAVSKVRFCSVWAVMKYSGAH